MGRRVARRVVWVWFWGRGCSLPCVGVLWGLRYDWGYNLVPSLGLGLCGDWDWVVGWGQEWVTLFCPLVVWW